MMDVTHGAHGEVVVHLDGHFDASAALRLSGWLVEIPSSDPLVLDFTQVRTCEDFGLASVARELAARDRLVVRGLTRHCERMLRYFGVNLEAAPGAPAGDDREIG
jgi:anti-anti-sigma regulatory factor